jgi:hypothetical protein
MPVREDLEVAVGVSGEHVEQLRVHERLAADDAKEGVAHLLGFAHEAVPGVEADLLLLGRDIDPATLAAQVAGVEDRHVQERRKKLAALHATFVPQDRERSFDPHVPQELGD